MEAFLGFILIGLLNIIFKGIKSSISENHFDFHNSHSSMFIYDDDDNFIRTSRYSTYSDSSSYCDFYDPTSPCYYTWHHHDD